MTPAELDRRIREGARQVILDVRSRLEHGAGHVPGARHIPFWRFFVSAPELPAGVPIVIYCGHGPRAWLAAAVLRARGRQALALLEGHWAAWRRAKLPEVRGRTPADNAPGRGAPPGSA